MGLTGRELCAKGPESMEAGFWFALTVKHQHERRAAGALSAGGVDTFLPLYQARRRWSDRVKELDLPLFPGYLFGRFQDGDRQRVLRTPGVTRIVGFGGIPAPVVEGELEAIRAALASKLPIGPWPYPKPGDRVRIEAGPLRGVEGTLVREKDACRLVLSVDLLQRAVAVEIPAASIAPACRPGVRGS